MLRRRYATHWRSAPSVVREARLRRVRREPALFEDRRPGRVGGVARRLDAVQVSSGDVDAPELRSGARTCLAAERNDAAVGRPGRALILVGLGEAALACAVGANDADVELAVGLVGKRDPVAARRPHWRGVFAFAEGDAAGGVVAASRAGHRRAILAHDVKFGPAATVGDEHDLAAVR